MASMGVPGALARRYEHLKHPLRVGADPSEVPPSSGGPALQVADRYSAGRKRR